MLMIVSHSVYLNSCLPLSRRSTIFSFSYITIFGYIFQRLLDTLKHIRLSTILNTYKLLSYIVMFRVLAKQRLFSVSTISKPTANSASRHSADMSKPASSSAAKASSNDSSGPCYFWNPDDTPYSYLSQWYPSPFTAPAPANAGDSSSSSTMKFLTTEQYMMYHKAILFKDFESAEKIMDAKKPAQHKALGRKVKGFDHKLWDSNKEKIVEEGNWNKFRNAAEELRLKEKLLETGDRELVEVRESHLT